MRTSRVYITGMTCSACSARIEKALKRTEGVAEASVNLATGQASVRFEPRLVTLQSILRIVERLGYGATDRKDAPGFEGEIAQYRNRLIAAVLLSLPLLWAMLDHLPFMRGVWTPSLFREPLLQLLLAAALQFGVGFPFYYGAYQALRHRSANMDVLVALSTSIAFFHSYFLMLGPAHTPGRDMPYFDAIAMILTAVLLGKWLESIAKGRALRELNALYDLQPRLARLVRRSDEEWVPIDQLRVGDRLSVLAGEYIAADGRVEAGSAEVDESMLTGESRTAFKRGLDRVYAGTRVVNGQLRISVEAQQSDTRLSRIIALTEEAQVGQSPLKRLVDRVAAIFVPAMIVCSAATYAGWLLLSEGQGTEEALRHALSVLVIACPCALGLATPVSVLIASSLAARSGIVVKESRSLETLHRIDCVLLDKTGTLTEGKPQLRAIHCQEGNAAYVLRMAAAIEASCSHPLAEALVRAARARGLLLPTASSVVEVPGGGASGIVEGKSVQVGRRAWLAEQGVSFPAPLPAWLAAEETSLYVAIEGRLLAAIAWADPLRPEAREVVRQLRQQAQVWIVTGDRADTAGKVAAASGIERICSEATPERKLELVRSLQREGRKVAMVGDGINDSAALAGADVGIAMGGGTDAAMQAGGIVLAGGGLHGVVDAMDISRRTMRNVRQNLGFALIYNAAAVPIAALGYLDPRTACIGMAASSVLVVTNALRLINGGGRREERRGADR